jgi:hypothetical protein
MMFLFTRELVPPLLELTGRMRDDVQRTLDYLRSSDYFFLRLSMASSKATADAAHGVEGSSVVSAMTFNCRTFAIRVSGLGDAWFEAPMPPVEAKLFEGHTIDEVEYMGGESVINETVGLGGFAQAASPTADLWVEASGMAASASRYTLVSAASSGGDSPDTP